jgi:hypothetical protein
LPWHTLPLLSANRSPHEDRIQVLRDRVECPIQRSFCAQPNHGRRWKAHIRSSSRSRVDVENYARSENSREIGGTRAHVKPKDFQIEALPISVRTILARPATLVLGYSRQPRSSARAACPSGNKRTRRRPAGVLSQQLIATVHNPRRRRTPSGADCGPTSTGRPETTKRLCLAMSILVRDSTATIALKWRLRNGRRNRLIGKASWGAVLGFLASAQRLPLYVYTTFRGLRGSACL